METDKRIRNTITFLLVATITTVLVIPGSGFYTFWHELGHVFLGGFRSGFIIDWSTGHGSVGTYRSGVLVSAAGTFMPVLFGTLMLWLGPFWLKGYSVALLTGSYLDLARHTLTDYDVPGAYEVAMVLTVILSLAYFVFAVLVVSGRAPRIRLPKITGFSVDKTTNRLVIHKTTK